MSKYRLDSFLSEELEGFKSTLKQTSYDSANDHYLCQDDQLNNVFNFDAYVQAKCVVGKVTPASPDAIYLGKRNLFFVEFRNQIWPDVDKHQMKRKFDSGTTILKEMLKGFTPKDCKYFFCVVHKKETSSRRYRQGVERAQQRFSFDELNKALGYFYDRVIVDDVDFYKSEFSELRC